MTEAILIEIAQRFRALEEAAENTELYDDMEGYAHPNPREVLEMAFEACRDDMFMMQEALRAR